MDRSIFYFEMFGKILKKLIGKSDNKKNAEEKRVGALREKVGKLSHFFEEKFYEAHDEFFILKDKFKNLRETNYKVGLKHLENDNLSEAIFRFRFMKKFWPDFFDAYYQLAYCLVLNNKLFDAKQVLVELLSKNPNYDPKGKELLDEIKKAIDHTDSDAEIS